MIFLISFIVCYLLYGLLSVFRDFSNKDWINRPGYTNQPKMGSIILAIFTRPLSQNRMALGGIIILFIKIGIFAIILNFIIELF